MSDERQPNTKKRKTWKISLSSLDSKTANMINKDGKMKKRSKLNGMMKIISEAVDL